MSRTNQAEEKLSQHSLSLAEQKSNYQPQTFKMSGPLYRKSFQFRGTNWIKGRKLSQRQEAPGLVEKASGAHTNRSLDKAAKTPEGKSRDPPLVLMPSLNGKIHIASVHQEAVESRPLPSLAVTMSLIHLGPLVSHPVSSDKGPTERFPRTTQERCLKSDRCLGVAFSSMRLHVQTLEGHITLLRPS